MHRRERWEILGRILALLAAATPSDPVVLSRVAQSANLPYDRFVTHLDELRQQGLVTADTPPRLTDKGQALLRSWQQWEGVLQRFGLD